MAEVWPRVRLLRVAILMAVLPLAAGCMQPEPSGVAWDPLPCDPNGVDRIAGGVEVLPFWNQSLEAVAQGYAEAAGHVLAEHRSSGAALHQWALEDDNGSYLGQLEVSRQRLPGAGAGSDIRIRSEAGLPATDGIEWARELVHRLAGNVSLRQSILDDRGILQVDLFQEFEGYRVIDTATLHAGLAAYRLHNNATELTLRPFYDLSGARIELREGRAVEIAHQFFRCARSEPVQVIGSELAVSHGTLVYAVDLRDANPNAFNCIPPILVDTVTGAVLGQASVDVCALPVTG